MKKRTTTQLRNAAGEAGAWLISSIFFLAIIEVAIHVF